MKNWKKSIVPITGALVILVLLGFVSRHEKYAHCEGVNIDVHSAADMYFIDKDDIYHRIVNAADSVEGRRMIDINVREVESAIASMPEVKAVDVFKTIDGKLNVTVDLRVPIARIFEPTGASFYLDEQGREMPLSPKYIARVLAVNGKILRSKIGSDTELPSTDSWAQQRNDLYRLAAFIDADPFWKSQIQQVYVDENIEYVLIPRVGNYEIEFGKMSDIATKFKQLNAFYEQALGKMDWNKYKSINLKYKNQIVCSKK